MRWWRVTSSKQAAQCLKNIKAIVECIDHALEDVVKVNIFLKNIADIDAVDEVYATFFPGGVPARRTVGGQRRLRVLSSRSARSWRTPKEPSPEMTGTRP